MTEIDLLSKAIVIATTAHAGQVDKLGDPYILHPLRVMIGVGDDPDARIVAVLHDVLEDTDYQAADLYGVFPENVIEALLLITRLPNEGYQSFIKVVATNALATKVKFHDIHDNLDPARMGRILVEDRQTAYRLIAKYEDALEILKEADEARYNQNPDV